MRRESTAKLLYSDKHEASNNRYYGIAIRVHAYSYTYVSTPNAGVDMLLPIQIDSCDHIYVRLAECPP